MTTSFTKGGKEDLQERENMNSFENYLIFVLSLISESLLIICYCQANLNKQKAAKDEGYFYNFMIS